jgi:hypothetical protein
LLAAVFGTGVCVGVLAALPQSSGIALVGIQSLAAGALLSVILIGSAATFGAARPRWRSALVAALIAVAVQHVWLYRTALANRRTATSEQPAVELFRPGWSEQSPLEYFRAEATPSTVALWVFDACLLTGAAVAIVEYTAHKNRTESS